MPFKKGTSGKGKDSSAKAIKQAIVKLLEHNLEQLQHDMDSLSPKDRLSFFMQYSEFVLPKLSRSGFKEEQTGNWSGLRDWVIQSVPAPNYEDDKAMESL